MYTNERNTIGTASQRDQGISIRYFTTQLYYCVLLTLERLSSAQGCNIVLVLAGIANNVFSIARVLQYFF